MPTFGTITAHIKVDGQELPEYDVQINQEETSVTCWIASETGKNFSIIWNNTDASLASRGKVILDGVYAGGGVLKEGSQKDAELKYWYTSLNTGQNFKFAPIVFTDDDTYISTTPGLGEIQLTVWHVKAGESRPCSTIRNADFLPSKLHERSKKLASHCVQLGDVQQIAPKRACKVKYIKKLADFVFRYRPLDVLQADGIVPLPPRPDPMQNNKRKYLVRNDDEIDIKDGPLDEDVDGRINQLKEELKRLESMRTKKTKVKTETLDRPLIRNIRNEVIDLT